MSSTRMDILKWMLEQIFRAERRREQLEDRLQRINRERETPIGGLNYDPMPRSCGEGNGAASILFKIADIEERIYEQKTEIEKSVTRVMDILEYLPINSAEREICELYYIDKMTWENVEEKVAISGRQCRRIRDKALEDLLKEPRIQMLIEESREEYGTWLYDADKSIGKKRAKK